MWHQASKTLAVEFKWGPSAPLPGAICYGWVRSDAQRDSFQAAEEEARPAEVFNRRFEEAQQGAVLKRFSGSFFES